MMTPASTDSDKPAELFFGELYRDEAGIEIWRIKEVGTENVIREGIASDGNYRWLLDCLNHGDDYADKQEALRAAAAQGSTP
jgi:hypothetical protein